MPPILTIGELEPDRPTVAISRNAPDGWWQAFKFEHLDVLLRWCPVRFAFRKDLYPLRLPSEFGLRSLRRLEAMRREIQALQSDQSEAADKRLEQLLRAITAMVLDAPADVIASLHPGDHLAVLSVFPRAVTGLRPTHNTAAQSPSTSAASSPASTASTVPGTG